MQNYIFRPGPVLVAPYCLRDGNPPPDAPVEHDVSDRADEYLFETIEMDPRVTLADVFCLLDRDPVLRQVFRRDWAQELCDEARKGAIDASSADPAWQEGIEWLELYQEWNLDTGSATYLPTQRLQLHGIGVELQEDAPDHQRKRGERIIWSVCLTSVRELLAVPLRVNPEVRVSEDDLDSERYGQEVKRVWHPDVTLGQIIEGVLHELGFHGGPDGRTEFAADLRRRMDELDRGLGELTSTEDVFGKSDQPGCDTLFDTLGSRSAYEVTTAMRRIGDDENAAAWFDREFDGEVAVKTGLRDHGGRQFRKAFRMAHR